MKARNPFKNIFRRKKLLPDVARNQSGSAIQGLFNQQFFHELLQLERKRSERSRETFFLVIINLKDLLVTTALDTKIIKNIVSAIAGCSRETDVRGWHEDPVSIGIIYTKVNKDAVDNIISKLMATLARTLGEDHCRLIGVTTTVFPEADGKAWTNKTMENEVATLYSPAPYQEKKVQFAIKRLLDIMVSVTALIAASPLLAIIAVIIKATSRGPVFFRQERIGLNGTRFKLLKFRSMAVDNDSSIHQEYVKKLIAGEVKQAGENGEQCFKMKDDPRVTPIGRFIRKTSIDELPQLINVLTGDMSIVGPRPPIAYEVEVYDIWHRRRILEMKPGITGLWQVVGRSTTNFDGMVRMDIEYIKNWSLWLDIVLILKTPAVLVSGKGAY
jgi:exopolysaccharide biosynthesis polyprenyl glycosylphosphotransferase